MYDLWTPVHAMTFNALRCSERLKRLWFCSQEAREFSVAEGQHRCLSMTPNVEVAGDQGQGRKEGSD